MSHRSSTPVRPALGEVSPPTRASQPQPRVAAQPRVATWPGSRRFDRQLGVPGIGPAEQTRLRESCVLVAGVGGVGGAAATYLAAAGVGRLVLVHPGELEEPDLNRQTLMEPGDVGSSRVHAAARTLRRHDPEVDVVAHDCPLADPRLPRLIAAADVVVDARHNFPERYLLNRLCRAHGVPEVVAAMDGAQLQLMTSVSGGPCWRCLFPDGDPQWQPLGFRVLGAVAGTVGCLAATEVTKLLAGAGTTLRGRLLFGDLWAMDFRTVGVTRRPGCSDCSGAGDAPSRGPAGRSPGHLPAAGGSRGTRSEVSSGVAGRGLTREPHGA
jgi:molybdopterin/thiamine biosynthesis adenylyltransferase